MHMATRRSRRESKQGISLTGCYFAQVLMSIVVSHAMSFLWNLEIVSCTRFQRDVKEQQTPLSVSFTLHLPPADVFKNVSSQWVICPIRRFIFCRLPFVWTGRTRLLYLLLLLCNALLVLIVGDLSLARLGSDAVNLIAFLAADIAKVSAKMTWKFYYQTKLN